MDEDRDVQFSRTIIHLQKAEWEARWHWKYTVQKEPYDEEAKLYLTKKALKLSDTRWEALEDSQRADLLSKELWIKANCEVCRHLLTLPGPLLGTCVCTCHGILRETVSCACTLEQPQSLSSKTKIPSGCLTAFISLKRHEPCIVYNESFGRRTGHPLNHCGDYIGSDAF